jgi:hypothetical protein
MKSFKNFDKTVCEDCSEAIRFHLENDIPFLENIFRMGSKGFFEFFIEAKSLYSEGKLNQLNESDIEILNTDIGDFGMFADLEVPLDLPMCEEDDKELNKPKRGGNKKY